MKRGNGVAPPPGFISLRSARTGRALHVNVQRICAYGQTPGVDEHSWLALQGRASLLFVLDSMEEIAAAISFAGTV